MGATAASTLCCLILSLAAQAQTTERVSVDSSGAQVPFGHSYQPTLCGDGHLVAFESGANTLVPGDTNARSDIFVRDRALGQTTRASLDSAGLQGDGHSNAPSLSADARFVAFQSGASNLVPGDTNGAGDIFVREFSSGQTTRVSVDSANQQGNAVSNAASISGDGRYVAFHSTASNLVPGDTNVWIDIFVHDRQTGQTTRANLDSGGGQTSNAHSFRPAISSDGRFVAFESLAPLVFGDSNNLIDIFVRDLQAGTTTRVSVSSSGAQSNGTVGFQTAGNAAISADGRYVSFWNDATNLVSGDTNNLIDVFVHDRQTAVTTRESVGALGVQGNGGCGVSSLSADGRFISFDSTSTNLVPGANNGWYHIFVRDRWSDMTSVASVDAASIQGNGGSNFGKISDDGRVVVFESLASNLVPGDTNITRDIFARDCRCSNAFVYCTSKVNSLGCTPQISTSGTPSAGAASGFTVVATSELNLRRGLLLYGGSGRASSPFQGGTLCVALALRTPQTNSGGSPAPASDCSGVYSIDMNAFATGALGGSPAAFLRSIGQTIDCQWWGRDRGFAAPNASSLSAGLEYVIAPR